MGRILNDHHGVTLLLDLPSLFADSGDGIVNAIRVIVLTGTLWTEGGYCHMRAQMLAHSDGGWLPVGEVAVLDCDKPGRLCGHASSPTADSIARLLFSHRPVGDGYGLREVLLRLCHTFNGVRRADARAAKANANRAAACRARSLYRVPTKMARWPATAAAPLPSDALSLLATFIAEVKSRATLPGPRHDDARALMSLPSWSDLCAVAEVLA